MCDQASNHEPQQPIECILVEPKGELWGDLKPALKERGIDFATVTPKTATVEEFDALRRQSKTIVLNAPTPEDAALVTRLFQESVRRFPI